MEEFGSLFLSVDEGENSTIFTAKITKFTKMQPYKDIKDLLTSMGVCVPPKNTTQQVDGNIAFNYGYYWISIIWNERKGG